MKRKIIIILLISPMFLFSQSKQDSVYQSIVMKVYENTHQYSTNNSLAGNWSIEGFEDMFVSLETQVVNDIPLFNDYNSKVSVKDYTKEFSKKYNKIGVEIKVLSIGTISFTDESYEQGELNIKVQKILSGPSNNKLTVPETTINKEGDVISTDYYDIGINYRDTVELIIKYKFYKDTYLKISDISLANPPKGQLIVAVPKVTTFFNRKNPKFIDEGEGTMVLMHNNKVISVPNFHFTINNIDEKTNITYTAKITTKFKKEEDSVYTIYNEDLLGDFTINFNKIKDINEDRILDMNFKRQTGSAFGEVSYSLNSSINILDNKFKSSNSSTMSAGIGCYFKLNEVNKFPNLLQKVSKYDLIIKASISKSIVNYTIDMNQDLVSYMDNDGELDYLRTVTINNLSEDQTFNLTNLTAKVGIELDKDKYAFLKTMSFLPGGVQFLVGGGYSIVNSATYSSSASSLYSGYYKDLYGVTLDGTFNEHNFGEDNLVQGSGNLEVKNSYFISPELTFNWKLKKSIKLIDFLIIAVSSNYYLDDFTNSNYSRIHSASNDLSNLNLNELSTVNQLIDEIKFSNIMFNVSLNKKF